MVIVISIHQVADKSVTWKQAAQATQFGAIWLQLIGQEVWQKLSYLFDQLPRLHKSLGNPTDLVCSRNDYILWYKFQKFKMCKKVLGYALWCTTTSSALLSRWSDKIYNCLAPPSIQRNNIQHLSLWSYFFNYRPAIQKIHMHQRWGPMDYVRHGKIQGQWALKKTKERPCISPCLT